MKKSTNYYALKKITKVANTLDVMSDKISEKIYEYIRNETNKTIYFRKTTFFASKSTCSLLISLNFKVDEKDYGETKAISWQILKYKKGDKLANILQEYFLFMAGSCVSFLKIINNMAIKNAYVTSPLENIIANIQKTLAKHNAKNVMYEYDNGILIGLTFGIDVNSHLIGVKFPARVAQCEMILRKQGIFDPKRKDHALRVAWANIRDWVDSQMAMVDLDMVKMEEVFLPYILDGQKTVYEIYQQKFIELPEGKNE